ncbi:MBL fold metallo-hydrolase [Bordetella genomosp. 7]|uniref:MBL fold metallo-hydrolase n=1 Tax=Bordetella genomosp. 7 TaxID=1416805 RepID=A0A261RQ87_9BORD|nr:MBL fold metallo-hydrolase [Bordetella genomosp. 7]OZI27216.1 MBL fold metallo-hydrolase [Bordetella genomosp. 7]
MRFPVCFLPRRLLGAFSLAATALVAGAGAATPAHAAAPLQTAQAPGFYRMALGDFVVTALYDGYLDVDPGLLTGATAADIQTLLATMFVPADPGVQTAVNAYVIQNGKHLVLVDTGAGPCMGPTAGGLAEGLRAAGFQPEQIDAVLLTHLHPDHACGLLTAQGTPRFPNADVYAARADADFWLSQTVAAQAPADVQPFFKMSRDAVAPYQATGKFLTYQPGETLLPGVRAVPTPGHTPGHTSYLFTSGRESLLVWGDIVHNHAVQFARPEVAIEFDVDSAQAIASRKKVFADAARDKLWVAGAHLPFPGLGHVRADGHGYAWVPAEYAPLQQRVRKP